MIHLVGSVAEQSSKFDEQTILATLDHPQALQHLATFTGRPATQLFVADETVVKLRTDFVFQAKDVERRTLAALLEERRLAVHHPEKTWFYCEWHGDLVIGNIAPRLRPLHNELPLLLRSNVNQAMAVFDSLFRLYMETALNFDRRLDEGLSNFGLDASGKLFYLDDDVYGWDEYTSLALVLGVWIRQLEALDQKRCRCLGELLAETLLDLSGSVHAIHMLHGQLRNNLAVGVREQEGIAAILQVLSEYSRQGFVQRRARERETRAAELTPTSEIDTRLTAVPEASSSLIEWAVNAQPADNMLAHISDPRFAVLADVHANVHALQAVLAQLDREGIEQILVLGDIVGYGPDPEACVELLQQRQCLVVQGNHDYAAATGDTHRGFSRLACWSIDWTREHIGDACRQWLAGLSPIHLQDHWMAVHGAPIDKSYFFAYVYHMTYQSNLDWLQEKDIAVAFHGHSHLQMSYQRRKSSDEKNLEANQDLTKNLFTLVCPGSVGQPRGGESRAEYAIYDSISRQLEMRHMEYDVGETVAAMQRLQFPVQLYERLLVGA